MPLHDFNASWDQNEKKIMLKTEAFYYCGFFYQQLDFFFIRSKNNDKNRQEMGLLSLSSLDLHRKGRIL